MLKDIIQYTIENCNNKLNGRDFITIGIFNAIGIVIYMAASFAMATTIIGGFIASGVSFMIAATVYILMAVKVKKKGVFTISGTLLVRRTFTSCSLCCNRWNYM